MARIETLYDRLPSRAKALATGLAAWGMSQRKYGRWFEAHLDFLLHASPEEHEERSRRQLERFLLRMDREHPVYRAHRGKPLAERPLLSKAELVRDYERYRMDPAWTVVRSSGSTGEPLSVAYNADSYQREYAFWWFHRSFGGVERGDRVATFGGHKVALVERDRPPFWALNPYENQLLFSSYHLSPQHMASYLEALEDFQPRFIHGYPSSLYLIAQAILERGRPLSFQPAMIAGASETTLDFQREVIEEAFGCKYYIWYGNTEYAGHITECPEGRLHAWPYHSQLRIVDAEGRDVQPGEEGEIVATCFSNTALPLINYRTRDRAIRSPEERCPCGRPGLLVERIEGRVEDYILTPSGRRLGRLDHLLKDAFHVQNAQLEQRALDQLIVRIVREPGYDDEVERAIEREARKRLDPEMEVRFDYVDHIPKAANGKFKFVVQHLKQGKLSAPTP